MQTDNFEIMRLHVIHEIAMKLIGSTFNSSDDNLEKRFRWAYKAAAEIVDSVSPEDKVVAAFVQ